jgi:hypothetical protein
MDHKLAIVIVPRESKDAVEASRALLERFESALPGIEPKFIHKRVGGWFDGLANGQAGQERWSTVLTMLLDGAATNADDTFPGFGPETGPEIQSRIEADNTLDLDDIWPLAPCSIIVTPDGEWAAHPNPDALDKLTPTLVTDAPDELGEVWAKTKRALFWEHRGATAVAWDLSSHFIGTPPAVKGSHPSASAGARRWQRHTSTTNRQSWATRISAARRRLAMQRPKD